jgi:hypothetical protein
MKLADFPNNLRDCDGIWYSETKSELFGKSYFGTCYSFMALTLHEVQNKLYLVI